MIRPAIAVGLALFALGACVPVETTTRNTSSTAVEKTLPAAAPSYRPVGLRIEVPDTLVVSEANTYAPFADIVWRGDEFGDRHKQVKALFAEAFKAADLKGGKPVLVSVKVMRFHALTEKARYVTGGNYAIYFFLQLSDPKTAKPLGPARLVSINQDAVAYRPGQDDHLGHAEHRKVIGIIRARIEKELGHSKPT